MSVIMLYPGFRANLPGADGVALGSLPALPAGRAGERHRSKHQWRSEEPVRVLMQDYDQYPEVNSECDISKSDLTLGRIGGREGLRD
jgi:hypothetical protein